MRGRSTHGVRIPSPRFDGNTSQNCPTSAQPRDNKSSKAHGDVSAWVWGLDDAEVGMRKLSRHDVLALSLWRDNCSPESPVVPGSSEAIIAFNQQGSRHRTPIERQKSVSSVSNGRSRMLQWKSRVRRVKIEAGVTRGGGPWLAGNHGRGSDPATGSKTLGPISVAR